MIIRPIQTLIELDKIYYLTHDIYVKNGYYKPNEEGKLSHYPQLDNIPETTVFIAIKDGEIVGTNSITLDGIMGLHVDLDFPDEVNKVRKERRRLVASWRIVTNNGIKVIVGLIKKTVDHALNILKADTALFTFHPKHESFYQKYLNAKTIARSDCISKLENAPAVLMRVDKETIKEVL